MTTGAVRHAYLDWVRGLAVLIIWAAHEASFRPSPSGRSDYWTSSASYFFLRVGLLTLLLPIGFLWEKAPFRHKLSAWSPLQEFGRASLFAYWVHVELVYGFFSRPGRSARPCLSKRHWLPMSSSQCFFSDWYD